MGIPLSIHLQILAIAPVIVVGGVRRVWSRRGFQRRPGSGLRPMKALKSRLRKMFKGRAD